LKLLPFDVAHLTKDTHFSLDSHLFTCPVEGVYMFALMINKPATKSQGSIFVDRINDVYAYLDTEDGYGMAQTSTLLIARCSAGDHVQAQLNGETVGSQKTSCLGTLFHRSMSSNAQVCIC
jgi:hypothetical protein